MFNKQVYLKLTECKWHASVFTVQIGIHANQSIIRLNQAISEYYFLNNCLALCKLKKSCNTLILSLKLLYSHCQNNCL